MRASAAHQRSTVGRWLTWLLLALMCLRALIPSGYMTAAADDGSITLVICTAHGAKTITLGPDADPTGEERSSTAASEPCAFAGLMPVVVEPPSAIAVAAPVVAEVALPAMPRRGVRPPARAGPAHGSRAPPIHS